MIKTFFDKIMPIYSKQLLAFMAVAEELHFGRAASRLHVSQPPLSQQVRQFEEEIGVPLLARTTRQVKLTAAGQMMLDGMQALLADTAALVTAAQRVAAGEAGLLRLGFTSTAAYRLVPLVVGAYHAAYPDVQLSMEENTSAVLLDKLLHDRIDVALMRLNEDMPHEELRVELSDKESLVVALPTAHTLATRRRIPLGLLEGQPLIGFARTSSQYFHTLLSDIFEKHGIAPTYVMESVLPTILALVEAGIGIAIVPASVKELRPNGVAYRPLVSPTPTPSLLYVVHRKTTTNPAVAAFVRIVRDVRS